MRKLIHSKFELDLSPFKLSDTEENSYFSDGFFTKYSFPFEIDLINDLEIATGFISEYNAQNVETYFDLLYVHNDKIHQAILEIESYQQRLSCTLRFGFEQLPSFDKKLSELSLDKFTLPEGTTIYEHAETVITQTFPAVNYNFPQIHIDKYDPTDELWPNFAGIINNRVSGAFLINEVIADETFNRNVMQPLPYWIHILQRGMIDAGFILSGKILTDPRLQKACLFGDVDYYTAATVQEDILINQVSEDAAEINYSNSKGAKASKYYSNTVLTTPGKYNISGTIKCLRWANFSTYFSIKYRNTVIWSQRSSSTGTFQGSEFRDYDIDVNFETLVDLEPNDITIEGYQYFTEEQQIINLTVSAIRLNDALGAAIPTVTNENKIDLTKAVPNMTFGEFLKVVTNWFNYDLTTSGNYAIMNPIEDAMNYNDAIDFSSKEVKYPYRKFSQGTSFLLKFQDIDNKDFKYLPVFHDNQGFVNSNYVTDDKTIPIEINGLPLPILTRTTVQTAYAFENNDSKVYLVKYDGLFNGNNLAQPIDEYEIPAVHLQYWYKWFDFRIFSQGFRLNFKAWQEEFANLTAKSKIYMYKRFHIIKSINKSEEKPELFTMEIETETLK
jgi:hypothetical protein